MKPVAKLILAGYLLLPAASATAVAAVPDPAPPASVAVDPAEVIAYQGDAVLLQREIDAAFSRLPEENRLLYIRDGAKVDQLIRTLLRRKVVAADAAEAGYDQDPVVAAQLRLEADRILAEAWLEHVLEQAPEADYEALAYEHYLANPDAYRSPETLDVSHILVGTGERTVPEARERAETLVAELAQDPAKFDELVREYSDDPGVAGNGGRYPEVRRGMMVAPFEEAAFALTRPGEFSQPVQTEYGFHIIRLNGRSGGQLPDYEAVRDEAVARARERYLNNYREMYLRKVLSDPVVIPEGAVEIMAKRHFGEDLELAPDYRQ